MIVIDNVIISDEVVSKKFVCDLGKCKGGCCEDGDAGAPLSNEELEEVRKNYAAIEHLLPKAAVKEVAKKGFYEYHAEFGWVTPTLPSDNEICVYAYREPDGMIKCAFEQAYLQGTISWRKPISCHLYPIIAKKGTHGDYDRVNYDPRETMCRPACQLGERLQVPVYKFLKEPLIRKYGEEFYNTLDAIAQEYNPGDEDAD
ncbi:MAG: DUF3109 family protein [Chitinophagaceae bacterium]|nr:DUF3109 family protein [Chitinophagaceae bacterium]